MLVASSGVRALAGVTVLRSWTRYFNLLSQFLSPARCINEYLRAVIGQPIRMLGFNLAMN